MNDSSVARLIERLEEATEGSRRLDGDIAEALGLQKNHAPRMFGIAGDAAFALSAGHCWIAPRYTTSLDATLPGEQIEMASIQRAPPGHPQKWSALDANWPRNKDGQYACMRTAGLGHTEALARRIAALRARQAMPQTVAGGLNEQSNTDES